MAKKKMVTTIEGDMIDEIAWRHYGTSSGPVEKMLDHNYRLSDQPEKLPAGVEIELPEVVTQVKIVRLWD